MEFTDTVLGRGEKALLLLMRTVWGRGVLFRDVAVFSKLFKLRLLRLLEYKDVLLGRRRLPAFKTLERTDTVFPPAFNAVVVEMDADNGVRDCGVGVGEGVGVGVGEGEGIPRFRRCRCRKGGGENMYISLQRKKNERLRTFLLRGPSTF